MKSFSQYYTLREGATPSAEVAAELEGMQNDIQRKVENLFKVIGRYQLNKEEAANLLITMIQNIAGAGNLSGSNARDAANQGMTPHSNEPISPPMQPMANG